MNKKTADKAAQSAIRCPKCGSTNVQREILRRINIGCLLLNALAFATLLERPGHFARLCKKCGHRFINMWKLDKKSRRIVFVFYAAMLLLYVGSYLFLTLRGGWYLGQTGEMRYNFGFAASDIIEWRPEGLWWQGRFKNVDGQYMSRGNLLGFLYSPLIWLDRAIWHKTRLSPFGEGYYESHSQVGGATGSQPIRMETNTTSSAPGSRR